LCLGINLTKEVKDQYTGNYKTLVKQIEEYANKWKDYRCSWVIRSNSVKMPILHNMIYNATKFSPKSQRYASREIENKQF
jgi:hypothetical protein